ncbi:doublecortin domain-containing protein 2 [Misgurnus anguillicaudatus]|uniref:doublecortin domain-containing protein 2 n=1 Tax=Misgurnus anguillicaudatus TaxID=75329 RepID=UPI003CCF7FCF
MNAEKPNFLSQPEVKNIYFYRNGDPYYEPRRLVINAKRVSTFDTLLREVTGGVRAQFGAVRNIYTPTGGHRVNSLEHLKSGDQYVAAGREKFKKIDYLQIGTRKKRSLQTNGLIKPVPQSRIIVSARFLKPIKEPCAIFIVANGDVLNPAVRLLIPSRVIDQFDRILEMITDKMGLRIFGGVRSLYTFDGALITDGKELENGQFYVAVGREKFKRLPYSDLLFSKPIGMKRVNGSKAASLPPIYKYRRQNGDMGNHVSKSVVGGSECGQDKSSPPAQRSKEQLSSIVREISQAKLMNIRKKRSGLTASQETHDDDDGEDRSADDKLSPVGSTVKQEAEVSPIPDQEDNSQEQVDIEDQEQTTDDQEQTTDDQEQTTDDQEQTTDEQEQTTEEKEQTTEEKEQTTEEQEQTTDESPGSEEEQKQEDENAGDENKDIEEAKNEDDGEIKDEGETSEEKDDSEEKKKEEDDGEEKQNEEESKLEEEERHEDKPENDGGQTEESPDQSGEQSADAE